MDSLALLLKLGSARGPPTGAVVFSNQSLMVVRVWQTTNSWGDQALSLVARRLHTSWSFDRRNAVYTVNFPLSVAAPPGGAYTWPFDIGDGTWDADGTIDRRVGGGLHLVALYEPANSPEAKQQNVWIGRLESAPVELVGPSSDPDAF